MSRFVRVSLRASDRAAFAEEIDGRLHLWTDAPWEKHAKATGEIVDPALALTLAPVTPGKILCVGRNYKAHANELGNDVPVEPLLFLKPSSSLLAHEGRVELPPTSISSRVDHEAELAVVIGARARRVSKDDALLAIFGLTIAGDITARDLQKKDGQWTRAKGMDGFCPTGPAIVTGLDPATLTITCRVNGETRQHGPTSDMIFDVATVISYASQVMTLEPGDLILTGTPPGVGPLRAGDVLEIEIPPIGVLRNHVVDAGGASALPVRDPQTPLGV